MLANILRTRIRATLPLVPDGSRIRGRPPLDRRDTSVSVHVRLPARAYDRMYQQAKDAKVTVPEVIRRRMAETRPVDEDER